MSRTPSASGARSVLFGGVALFVLPLLTWLTLRWWFAVGLPESWLTGLSVLRWVWLLGCAALIFAGWRLQRAAAE